jgi:hypothetical protein
MPTQSSGAGSSLRATTDLIDEQKGAFLVQYPILLVIGLALSGVVAFALTGFLGYSGDTGISGVFHDQGGHPQAWLLFLWLSALIITLFASIFRDKSLRGHLIASMVVTVLAVVLVGITYYNSVLPKILQQLLAQHVILVTLAKSTYTYSVINFSLLAIFWGDTIRRWSRRARGEAPISTVDIGLDSDRPASKSALPSLQELVSGDLIAAAVLTVLLAGLFWYRFLPNFIHPVDAHDKVVNITGCTLSWPAGACAGQGGMPTDPPTLTFIDSFQSLVYLPLGLLILALSAMLSGFGAVGGVDEGALRETDVRPADNERAGALPIAEDVASTVLGTLRAALSRRLKLLGGSLALSLRTVAWPCLTVIAIYAVASLSSDIEAYLHSHKHLSDLGNYVVPAAVWGVVAVLGAIATPALMLFRWRVAENTARFLRLIGFIVLLTFWIFSLALFGVDQLLDLTGATHNRHPFSPPSFSTALSFASLAIFGLILLFRRSSQATTAGVSSSVPQSTGNLRAPSQR